MSLIHPWEQPQKRIALPAFTRLVQADEQTAHTLAVFSQEPTVEIELEPNDETDYVVLNRDGSVTRVCQCVTINGVRWDLVPGKNNIPRSVYEFLMQCPAQRTLLPAPAPGTSRLIGNLLR